MSAAPSTARRKKRRNVAKTNLNHHLWQHGKKWWVYCAVNPTARTKDKLRRSLCTESVKMARLRRDMLFRSLQEEGILGRMRAMSPAAPAGHRKIDVEIFVPWKQRVDVILARIIAETSSDPSFPVTVVGAGHGKLQLCC